MPAVKRNLVVMVLVLLVAAALRIVQLQGVPPGLQHDEVFYAHDAISIQQGQWRLFFSDNQGREPLFIYLLALTTATIGDNAIAIRIPAVFSGLLGIALTFRWALTLFGRRIALTSAALMAVGFWAVWLSRAGLRVATLIPVVALFGWLFSEALKRSSQRQPATRWYVGAGLALGLSFYTYAAAYVLPAVLIALIIYLTLFRLDVLRSIGPGLLITIGIALVLFAPLGLTIASEGYTRAANTSTAITALQEERNWQPLFVGLGAVLQMFTSTGDPQWRYNVSGRPVFSLLTGAFFIMGAGSVVFFALRAIYRAIRRHLPNTPIIAPGRADSPFWAMLTLWLLLGLLPSALTDQPPSFLRTTTVLPLVYIFAAVGVEALRRSIVMLPDARDALPFWPLVVLVIIGISAFFTVRDYFGTWSTHPEVQRIYRVDLAEVAGILRSQDEAVSAVAISTTEPNNLDPFIFAYTPHGERHIHWFDGANSLMLPVLGGDLYYTLEPQPHPVAEQLTSQFELTTPSDAQFVERIELPPVEEVLEVIDVPQSQPVYTAQPLAFPPRDPDNIRTELNYPVEFGEVATLIGYYMPTQSPAGEWLPIQMYFRVEADVLEPQAWALFVHLLDANGTLVAGRDFLGVPPFTWREGDVFIHFHDVPLPQEIPPGDYHVEIGLYALADGARFQIMVDGQPMADRLLFEPILITNTAE